MKVGQHVTGPLPDFPLAWIGALVTAALSVAVAFGVHLTDDQRYSVMALAAAVSTAVVWADARIRKHRAQNADKLPALIAARNDRRTYDPMQLDRIERLLSRISQDEIQSASSYNGPRPESPGFAGWYWPPEPADVRDGEGEPPEGTIVGGEGAGRVG